MEAILDLLAQHAGPWAFVLLVACGLGLPPWSEEIVTVGVGLFVSEGHISLVEALIWCWGGILAGDSVVFFLGEHIGERVYRWPILRRHLSVRRRHRFNQFFLKHGTKAVLAARFVPGVRIIAYFVAGNLRMPYWKFFLLDSLGAALYAPAGVLLGHWFADNLEEALVWLRRFEIPLAAIAILVLVFLIRGWGRNRRARLRALLELRATRAAARRARRAKSGERSPEGTAKPRDSSKLDSESPDPEATGSGVGQGG